MDYIPRLFASSIASYCLPTWKHEALTFTKSTRLLTLHPPRRYDFLLRCSVEEVDLDRTKNPNLHYNALSYTWFVDRDIGKPVKGNMRLIVCNGGILEVHENLCDALVQLRDIGLTLPLWVDAICINQDDDDEKSTQVNMMGDIYGEADAVLVWLGRKTLLTRVALHFGRWLLGPRETLLNFLQGQVLSQPRGVLDHFKLLTMYTLLIRWTLGRGFFERVWTLQEVVLAKAIIFYLGEEALPIHQLAENFPYMEIDNHHHIARDGETFADRPMNSIRSLIFMLRARNERLQGQLCSLEVAVSEARRRQTTKPADKVFAILSIAETGYLGAVQLRANYRKNVAKVYIECARALLAGPSGLKMLSLVGQLRYAATEHPFFPAVSTKALVKDAKFVEGLPSWVPDLTCQARPRPLRTLLHQVQYNAATALASTHRVTANDTLVIKAAVLDVITEIGDGIDHASVEYTPFTFIDLAARFGPTYIPTGEPLISAFSKTLVAGETLIHIRNRPEHVVEVGAPEFADWFAEAADIMILGTPAVECILLDPPEAEFVLTPEELNVESHARRMHPTAFEKVAIGKLIVNAFRRFINVHDTQEYDLRGKIRVRLEMHRSRTGMRALGERFGFQSKYEDRVNPHPYKTLLDKFYLHRRLFATEKGYMGTGPWTVAKGDVVMLVAGADTPFVFRPKGKCWELVGEAYCHGAMGGTDSAGKPAPGVDLDSLHFTEMTLV